MINYNPDDPHAGQPIIFAGAEIEKASSAMIMIHGRGSEAEGILSLTDAFENKEKIIFAAPQAANNTWYPFSFISPKEMNEPGITSGLNVIKNLIADFESKGIPPQKIIILGFSQGACLMLEYCAGKIKKYGGIIGLSGGLIGDKLDVKSYFGNFENTPVFLGCSDIDPHIPLVRVDETEQVFLKCGAKVTKKIYPGMGHTINREELIHVNKIIAGIV